MFPDYRSWCLTFLILLLMTSCSSQVNIIPRVPASVAIQRIAVPLSAKKKLLEEINAGEFRIAFSPKNEPVVSEGYTSLTGEYRQLIFDLVNEAKTDKFVDVQAVLPEGWSHKIYRQTLLNDWYSANPRKEDIVFFGDAIMPITGNRLKLKANETVRLVLDLVAGDAGSHEVGISVNLGGSSRVHTSRMEVMPVGAPSFEFPSILFNSGNYQSGKSFVAMGKRAGMTHLQVNYIPEVIFDKEGAVVSGINSAAAGSTGFRNTALPWMKSGGSICLFWQPRYEKLAPLEDGTFLIPFTSEWERAFTSLLRLVLEDIERRCPECSKDGVVLYLADEFSAATKKNNNQSDYLSLIMNIKREVPEIPVLVTFGFYTSPEEVRSFSRVVDVNALHFSLPEKIERKNRSFEPIELLTDRFSKSTKNATNWAYQIGKGKTSDIREFFIYPMQAALRGEQGFSWWAFADHQGSCWIANDGHLPDYSLVYTADAGNPVFEMWQTDVPDQYIPSMRLFATRSGLDDARILSRLLSQEQALTPSLQLEFQRIKKILSRATAGEQSSSPEIQISLGEIGSLRDDLRRLYAAAQSGQ